MSAFATKLKQLREQAGLSMYALAKQSGVSKQALSRLELGINEPAWETVQRLALALGVDCRSFTDPGIQVPGTGQDSRSSGPAQDAGSARSGHEQPPAVADRPAAVPEPSTGQPKKGRPRKASGPVQAPVPAPAPPTPPPASAPQARPARRKRK